MRPSRPTPALGARGRPAPAGRWPAQCAAIPSRHRSIQNLGADALHILLGLTLALTMMASGEETPGLPDDGPALAEYLRSTPPPESMEVTGLIRIRQEDGRRTSLPFHYRVITGEKSWQQIFQTSGKGMGPAQKLRIAHSVESSPVYTLSATTGVPGESSDATPLTGEQAMVPFAGSDFWLADLGLEFLHWPEQRIDRNTKLTMRKGRSCRVLESANPRQGAAGYTRVRSWVDIKTGGIIIAEAYGSDQRIAKEFEIGGFTKVNDHWVLKDMEIRNLRTDTRTILEFHYELDE